MIIAVSAPLAVAVAVALVVVIEGGLFTVVGWRVPAFKYYDVKSKFFLLFSWCFKLFRLRKPSR